MSVSLEGMICETRPEKKLVYSQNCSGSVLGKFVQDGIVLQGVCQSQAASCSTTIHTAGSYSRVRAFISVAASQSLGLLLSAMSCVCSIE